MDQKNLIKFLEIWIATSIAVLVLSYIFGSNLVLGNAQISQAMAGVVFGLILTVVFFLISPISLRLNIKIKDEKAWAAVYFAVNTVVVWIVKRLADFTGVGVSNIFLVLVIALVVTLVEWSIDKYAGKLLKAK